MRATSSNLPRTEPVHPYLPTLDGWRAVAVLLVMLTHDRIHRLGPLSTDWLHQGSGPGGVELFFAISGLLIGTRLLAEERSNGTLNLRNFYLKRCFRIWPAAWLYLAVVCAMMATGIVTSAYSSVLYALLMVRNYLPLKMHAQDWYTLHFWSLSVEEHFYLLLPGFLLLVRRHRAVLLAAMVLLLTAWERYVGMHPALNFGWWPAFRTDIAVRGLLIAVTFAVLLQRQEMRTMCERWLKPWIVLPLAGVVAVLCAHRNSYLSHDVMLLVYTPVVLCTLLHPLSLAGRVLEWQPLRLVGRVSYSLYLWQMILLPYSIPIAAPHAVWLVWLTASWLRYPAIFVAAFASYYGVEKPMIRLGHALTHSPEQPREVAAQPSR